MKQTEKIIKYLEQNKKISQREAYRLGIYRLASRVCDIRRQGIPIISERKKVENADGTTSIISVYSLGGNYDGRI